MGPKLSSKILLIDQSRFSCLYYTNALAPEQDITLKFATSVGNALHLADEYLPTVVLLALDEDRDTAGIEDLQAIRSIPSTKDVPVIMLCDEVVEHQAEQRLLEAGVSDLLVKSNGLGEMVERIRSRSREYLDWLRGDIPKVVASDEDVGPARVLMIDDSKMICSAIEKKLADENVVFTYVNDPALGLKTAKEFRPTVILLDLEMPGLTGFDLLPMLREDPLTQDIPVIVLSAITEPKTKARVFLAGANDYAEKQMDRVELSSRLQYHSRAYVNSQRLNESINDLLEARKRLEIQRNFIRKTFGRYLSDEVVGNILDTPEGLELGGEKREISILMSDLRGFTSLSERMAPEEVLSIINNFLLVMTDILMKYQGTIDEFIGDAILAMFGAPVLRPGDAVRAVACAVEMQMAMEDVNRWNREQGYPDVAMGIGLNTGEVVVGNIGSERRCKYGIVGRHVNLAARIESYTVGGQILVPESTLLACGDLLRIDDQMEVMPKGVKEPITIYDVGGVGGDFQLFLPEKEELVLLPVDPPLPIKYTVIAGKHGDSTLLLGNLVKLLGETAEVEVKKVEERLTNLKLIITDRDGGLISDEAYGKVVSAQGEGDPPTLTVTFTSLTPEARAFLESIEATTQEGSE